MMQAILSFDVDAETPILVEGRRYADNAGVMSHQAFGPLVGVPRIIQLLEEYERPATFFVPGVTADRYPQTLEQILAAGHEVGHHSYAHFSPFDQNEEAERADFGRALATLERFGVKPEGFRCPSFFVLTCHPFLSGRPHRVEILRALIEHALAAGDVEFVDGREAARRARADDGLQRRRLEPVVVDEQVYPEY